MAPPIQQFVFLALILPAKLTFSLQPSPLNKAGAPKLAWNKLKSKFKMSPNDNLLVGLNSETKAKSKGQSKPAAKPSPDLDPAQVKVVEDFMVFSPNTGNSRATKSSESGVVPTSNPKAAAYAATFENFDPTKEGMDFLEATLTSPQRGAIMDTIVTHLAEFTNANTTFAFLDPDSSGEITWSEAGDQLKKYLLFTDADVTKWIPLIGLHDLDHSGGIDFFEWSCMAKTNWKDPDVVPAECQVTVNNPTAPIPGFSVNADNPNIPANGDDGTDQVCRAHNCAAGCLNLTADSSTCSSETTQEECRKAFGDEREPGTSGEGAWCGSCNVPTLNHVALVLISVGLILVSGAVEGPSTI